MTDAIASQDVFTMDTHEYEILLSSFLFCTAKALIGAIEHESHRLVRKHKLLLHVWVPLHRNICTIECGFLCLSSLGIAFLPQFKEGKVSPI
jgi:hypothetical protein